MTLPTFDPAVEPTVGITDTPEIKILKADFGDGYTQATAAGLNHIRNVREMTWDALYKSERDPIIAFFRERGGYQPFWFKLDDEASPTRYTCEKWSEERISGGFFKISATFRQCFTLAV
ncbi:phage tail protein [Aureimonas leprariae]|uniref:Phage tail protein n=1 Tax=Plantimonas leprariae TaxID=2615207 RepID=A0A7V7TZJ6_9HYPH|nr:phage tail protein [Aureimonas leprariae]KAB0679521.1 phage tail protein [Aureimonas leprariae]